MRFKVSLSEGFAHQDTAPTGWVVKRLGDCAELVREHFDPTNGEIRPYIGLEHIQPGTLRLCGVGKSSEVTSGKFAFRAGDILFGKLRPYFRKVVRPSFDGVCSTDIFVIRAKPGTDQRFLFYWLTMPETIEIATQTSEGTRMPRAVWDVLAKIERPVPPLPEQQRIAEILGALDDKIELNHRMNRTLEAIARAIFKSWFVDFEPFRNGEFVDSELGPIPKGWEVKRLGEVCSIVMGQSPPSSTYNTSGDGLPFYQGIRDFGFRFPTPTIFCSEPKKIAQPGDVLISVRAPVGELNVAAEKVCIGRGIGALRLKQVENNFLFYLLQETKTQWETFGAKGTVFGAVTKESPMPANSGTTKDENGP